LRHTVKNTADEVIEWGEIAELVENVLIAQKLAKSQLSTEKFQCASFVSDDWDFKEIRVH
jgi:hypothetical protein